MTLSRPTMTWYPWCFVERLDDVDLPSSMDQWAPCSADTHSARSWGHGISGFVYTAFASWVAGPRPS